MAPLLKMIACPLIRDKKSVTCRSKIVPFFQNTKISHMSILIHGCVRGSFLPATKHIVKDHVKSACCQATLHQLAFAILSCISVCYNVCDVVVTDLLGSAR
jgi:hypothetical protein